MIDDIKRRDILKTVGVIGAGIIVIDQSQTVSSMNANSRSTPSANTTSTPSKNVTSTRSANTNIQKDTDLHRGSIQFVEAKLEFLDVPDEAPRIKSDGFTPYVVNEKQNQLSIITAPVDQFSDGSTVLYDGAVQTIPTQAFERELKRQITFETDFPQSNKIIAELEGEINPPNIAVKKGDRGDKIRITVDGRPRTIPAGHTKSIKFSTRDIRYRGKSKESKTVPNPRDKGPETVRRPKPGPINNASVTPSLTVRNHGSLNVYGKKGAWVLPLETSDEWVQTMTRSIRNTNNDAVITENFVVFSVGGGAK